MKRIESVNSTDALELNLDATLLSERMNPASIGKGGKSNNFPPLAPRDYQQLIAIVMAMGLGGLHRVVDVLLLIHYVTEIPIEIQYNTSSGVR